MYSHLFKVAQKMKASPRTTKKIAKMQKGASKLGASELSRMDHQMSAHRQLQQMAQDAHRSANDWHMQVARDNMNTLYTMDQHNMMHQQMDMMSMGMM